MALAPSSASAVQVETPVAAAVRQGLSCHPRRLPPWLFYDDAGSRLFEQITSLPEYYLTRTERGIFAANADAIIAEAVNGERLRIAELGAGSAAKTSLLLSAAVERQGSVVYEPIDVSASALQQAARRIEREIAGVTVAPRTMDYTNCLDFAPARSGEHRLVLYIGSSIGNFEPEEAAHLLRRLRAKLRPGDALLLGVDLVKGLDVLVPAYDDAAGVTGAFNRNVLCRINRELGGDFDLDNWAHTVLWNGPRSRIEMHLSALCAQRVHIAALDMTLEFEAGETIHTENSYKYAPGRANALLRDAGFEPASRWTDEQEWFAVCLARAA